MWLGRLFCILSLVVLSGLDQAVVQSYAWATMIQDRAPELGVSEAIEDTFSGEHPCEICQALAETTLEEQEDAPADRSADELPKIYSPLHRQRNLFPFPTSISRRLALRKEGSPRDVTFEIPTPPPELV